MTTSITSASRCMRRWLGAALLLGASAGLAQEADIVPTPAPDPARLDAAVRVRAGSRELPTADAAAFARGVLPYATLANEAYCHLQSDAGLVSRPQGRDANCPGPDQHLAHGWTLLATYPSGDLPPRGRSARGLGLNVYYRDGPPGQPVALTIAFRGTELDSWTDWHSNLHWFLPGRDQYQVLAEISARVISDSKAEVQRRLGRPVDHWQIVTTGHSLGGGLAQLMAYKNREVSAAVVFHPSPVTGYHTCVSDAEVHCNVPVWRVHARGEVLSYVRALLRQAYRLSENITEVEYAGVPGNMFNRHSMPDFLAVLRRADLHPVLPDSPAPGLFAKVVDCSCIGLRQPEDGLRHRQRCQALWNQLDPTDTERRMAQEDALLALALAMRDQRLQALRSEPIPPLAGQDGTGAVPPQRSTPQDVRLTATAVATP